MTKRIAALCLLLPLALLGEPNIEIWHGTSQRVGHLGDAQDDFNLMGVANEARLIVTGLLLVMAVSVDRGIERLAGGGS